MEVKVRTKRSKPRTIELRAILKELQQELLASDEELDALSSSDPGFEKALGLLAERRGQLLTQMTLVAGMLKRDESAHLLHELARSRGAHSGAATQVSSL